MENPCIEVSLAIEKARWRTQLLTYRGTLTNVWEKNMRSNKSPGIKDFMNGMASAITGVEKDIDSVLSNKGCMLCNGRALEFKDELSEKEYGISGMCQSCQDKMFGGE